MQPNIQFEIINPIKKCNNMQYFQSEKIAKARKKLSITAEKLVEETLDETNKTEKHVEKMRNIIDDLDEDIDSPFFKMPLPPPPKPKVSDRDQFLFFIIILMDKFDWKRKK